MYAVGRERYGRRRIHLHRECGTPVFLHSDAAVCAAHPDPVITGRRILRQRDRIADDTEIVGPKLTLRQRIALGIQESELIFFSRYNSGFPALLSESDATDVNGLSRPVYTAVGIYVQLFCPVILGGIDSVTPTVP